MFFPKTLTITPNVFSSRNNCLEEAKQSTSEKYVFHTRRPKHLPRGFAQVKSGEKRTSKLDGGAEQQIRGNWMSSTVTHNMLAQKIERSWSQGCTGACQIFGFKAATSERRSSPLRGGSSTLALIIQKAGIPPQLGLPVERLQRNSWRALKPVCVCVNFVYVFDLNGARKKANIRRNYFSSYLSPMWKAMHVWSRLKL